MVNMKLIVGKRENFNDIWWKFSEKGEKNESKYEIKI